MAQDCIQLSVDNRNIATLSLHRPELHNAIDDTMTQRLTRELQELGRDPAIRAVVLTGSGMNFSTGHDMQWLARMNTASEATLREQADLLATLLHTLDTLPKPTIAKIHGSAFGIGVGLVACCDLAISCTDSLFGFSQRLSTPGETLSVPHRQGRCPPKKTNGPIRNDVWIVTG